MERRRFSGVMLLFIVLAVVLITQVVVDSASCADRMPSSMATLNAAAFQFALANSKLNTCPSSPSRA